MPKDFRQRRPDGSGGHIWNLDKIERVLYALPELEAADAYETVCICEGEKDADLLRSLGFVATTNVGGAGKWREEYSEKLRARRSVVLPDNDKAGGDHAATVAASLLGIAASVKIVKLPGVAAKGDVSEWFACGGTPERLVAIVDATEEYASPITDPAISQGIGHSVAHAWPSPLAAEAFHGLAGEIIEAIEPHTEADSAALLIQFLIALGNCIGRSPYFMAEADRHSLNLFGVLVGETSKGRKGTSWGHIRRIFAEVDPDWLRRVMDGLSSGEGLIEEVRDASADPGDGKEVEAEEAGTRDKRLLAMLPEFAALLQVQVRQGTTLPSILRNAWDGSDLRVMTRKNPLIATGAHISIIGHITKDELLRLIDDTSATNGFLNRFLWFRVHRSKLLPFGGRLSDEDLFPLIQRLREVVAFARSVGEMRRDAGADALWAEVYPDLTEPGPGMVGAILGRAEPIVMRIACLYALLDMERVIRPDHLVAALAVWAYSAESVRWIFGDRLGDPVADELLRVLRLVPEGMTRTEINDHLGGHRQRSRIAAALQVLHERNLARCSHEETKGRPTERWFAVKPSIAGEGAA